MQTSKKDTFKESMGKIDKSIEKIQRLTDLIRRLDNPPRSK